MRPSSNLVAVAFVIFSVLCCYACPSIQYHREIDELKKRQNDQQQQQQPPVSPTIWTPTAVIFIICFAIALFACICRVILRRRGGRPSVTLGETELTANELAGETGTRRPRRHRRPRRTPSQISVTSLPEYMKEPGAEEVVIFRGQIMDSMPLPPHFDEDGEDAGYSMQPASQSHVPLLHENEEENDAATTADNERSRSVPQAQPHHLRMESIGSASNDHTSSLQRLDTPEPAPAYFEVVTDEEVALINQPAAAATSFRPPHPERLAPRSGFRNFLTRISTSHQRGDSGSAGTTALPSHPSQHRQTPSTFSLNSFRSSTPAILNNNHSDPRMTSPSLISLTSISAPLTHTAVRTEFMYPKAGPTAEQLKIIASREAITKFGLPYGPDAIAFAASTSGYDLPPEFEELEVRSLSGPSGFSSSAVIVPEAGSSSRRKLSSSSSSAPTENAALTASASSSSAPNGHAELVEACNVIRSNSIASRSSDVTFATATESFNIESGDDSLKTESASVTDDDDDDDDGGVVVGHRLGHTVETSTSTITTSNRGRHEVEPSDVTLTPSANTSRS